MEEKALIHGDWPFAYLLPAGAGKAKREATADFVADDQPITEQDLAEMLEDAYNELEAA